MVTINNLPTVSCDQLTNTLKQLATPVIATIEAITEPKLNKRGNPLFGRVKKHAIVNGVIGAWNYQNSVNNRRMIEADPQTQADADAVAFFESLPRCWGERLKDSALVEYKGGFYLEIRCKTAVKVNYLVDGRAATQAELDVIKAFTPQRKEGERQELNQPIILRDYKVENIQSITYAGQSVVVTN
jgi:hypothetical protein